MCFADGCKATSYSTRLFSQQSEPGYLVKVFLLSGPVLQIVRLPSTRQNFVAWTCVHSSLSLSLAKPEFCCVGRAAVSPLGVLLQ